MFLYFWYSQRINSLSVCSNSNEFIKTSIFPLLLLKSCLLKYHPIIKHKTIIHLKCNTSDSKIHITTGHWIILCLDHCLTTILKNAGKTESRCAATVSGFSSSFVFNCAKPMKRLCRKGFAFDRLITPTFQAFPVEISGNPLQPLAFSQCRGKSPFLLTTIWLLFPRNRFSPQVNTRP